jgi:transcription initiation factor IIE alpha subunit
MEIIVLHDISEEQLKGILNFMPEIWKKNSGFFDTGLTPIFKNFGESDDLLFGVHIFSHGNGAVLFIILTEYMRDSRMATFNINSRHITGWFGVSSHKKGEIKLREILEDLTYDELDEFATVGQHLEDDSIFICPNCKAQYHMKVLRVSVDGRTECQNCKGLFSPDELALTRDVREESGELFICPKCNAQFSLDELPINEEGRIECLNCWESYDPVELDISQRAASHDS